MNETMSLLLATTILALGGVCLYVFKSSDTDDKEENVELENSILGNFFNWESETNKEENLEENNNEYDEPDRKKKVRTQKNRKNNSNSRRKYY
jgi:hypothetical protein